MSRRLIALKALTVAGLLVTVACGLRIVEMLRHPTHALAAVFVAPAATPSSLRTA